MEQFNSNLECLSVGCRRFPLDIKYSNDLMHGSSFPVNIQYMAKELTQATDKCCRNFSVHSTAAVPTPIPKIQYNLAVALIRLIGRMGTGILVFVSGINDITELTERFEGFPQFKVIAIHSDIPFEEQETAFIPAGPSEIKVIIATNAGENSSNY